MTPIHIDWLSSIDAKLTATTIFLILPVALILVIAVPLVARSRYLANVSLLGPSRPIATANLELHEEPPLCFGG